MKKLLLCAGNTSIKIVSKLFDTGLNSDLSTDFISQNDFLFISTEKSFLERLNMPENQIFYLPAIQNSRCLEVKNGIEFSKAEINLILRVQNYEKIVFLCDGFVFSYLLLLNALFELSLCSNIELQVFCSDAFSHQHFIDRDLEKKITYILPKRFVQFLSADKNYRKNFEKQVKTVIIKALSNM